MKPSTITKTASRITAPVVPDDPLLRFSFKLLDIHTNDKFGLHHAVNDGYWEKLLLRFKDISRMKSKEFRENFSKQLRNHRITFSETSEPEGFALLPEQLRGQEAWQFELTQQEHGRVHGLLMGDTFYIVWLDPCHKLYPSDDAAQCHAAS